MLGITHEAKAPKLMVVMRRARDRDQNNTPLMTEQKMYTRYQCEVVKHALYLLYLDVPEAICFALCQA